MISHLRTRYIPIITHYISPSHTQITCDVLCITCRTSAKQHKDGQRNELRRASCGEHVPSRGMLISVCNQDGRSMIFNTCFHVSQFSIYFWVVIYILYIHTNHANLSCIYILYICFMECFNICGYIYIHWYTNDQPKTRKRKGDRKESEHGPPQSAYHLWKAER
jgi:hypothetical protein